MYNEGNSWTKRFVAWTNRVESDQPSDEDVSRGHLAKISYSESRIWELEHRFTVSIHCPSFANWFRSYRAFEGLG